MKRTILYLLFCSITGFFGCSKDESSNTNKDNDVINNEDNVTNNENCMISKIRTGIYAHEHKYNENGLFLINALNYSNPSNVQVSSYYVNYIENDSITIGYILDNGTKDNPLISAKYEGKNLIKLERFYGSSSNIFDFEYGVDKIRVTESYKSLGLQKIDYGDYFINEKGNITDLKKYKYDPDDESIITLFEEKSFTYDNSNNPWKGIIYSVFLCQELPETTFFSSNNILTETKNSNTTTFHYEYDNGTTIKGWVLTPLRCNTIDNIVEEFYSYKNCYSWP